MSSDTDSKALSDEELAVRYQKSRDDDAASLLINRYRDMVRHIAKRYFLFDYENEDFVQEGTVGLYRAIRDYDPNKGKFSVYAWRCIERQIQTVITRGNSLKRRIPKDMVLLSIDEKQESGEWESMAPTDEGQDPASITITNETIEQFRFELMQQLSPVERDVFTFLAMDYDYTQIAKKLNKDKKSIDNAIQRIRKKAKRLRDRL